MLCNLCAYACHRIQTQRSGRPETPFKLNKRYYMQSKTFPYKLDNIKGTLPQQSSKYIILLTSTITALLLQQGCLLQVLELLQVMYLSPWICITQSLMFTFVSSLYWKYVTPNSSIKLCPSRAHTQTPLFLCNRFFGDICEFLSSLVSFSLLFIHVIIRTRF